MSREYRESKKSKPVRMQPRIVPAWFWMFLGFLPGLVLAVLTYLDKHDPRRPTATGSVTTQKSGQNTSPGTKDTPESKVATTARTQPSANNKSEPKGKEDFEFTFFTEAPKLEVVVSEQDIAKDAKLHQQKTSSAPKVKKEKVEKIEKNNTKLNDKQLPPTSEGTEKATATKVKPSSKTIDTTPTIPETVNTAPLEHRYVLQVGSFKKQAQAEQRQTQLTKVGIQAHIENIDIKGETWFRVRIGPFDDYKHIQSHLEILKQHSISAITVKLK